MTNVLREQLKASGTLSKKEETHRVFDPLGWTDAQKRLVDHYEPGVQLRFVKTTAQFRAGESVAVVGHVGKQLRVQRSDGRAVTFSPTRSPSSFEVGQSRELGVAAGDVLLLRANAPGFVNGERVTVKAAQRERITLTDGRALPENYRTFTHGYAVTSHAAQGKTVDEVLVVASSQSFAAVSQEQFYVSISRARERARVYTDDSELLGRRVEDTHTRKAALELDGLHSILAAQGFVKRPPHENRREAEHEHVERERAFRATRTLRTLRNEATQRLGKLVEDFKRWLGLRVAAAERVDLAPRLTRELTFRERVSARMQQQQRPDIPRQSRGMRM